MTAGVPTEKSRNLWRQRWRVMKDCGVPTDMARKSRCSLDSFRKALASVGRSADEWPHLNVHLGPGRWSSHVSRTERGEWSRWAYRALKSAGMGSAHAINWCRSEVAFHYALHCLTTGKTIPLMPSEAQDKHTIIATKVQEGRQSWEE